VSLYADSSALLKVYLKEPETEACKNLLADDPIVFTARHTLVEVRRILTLALKGKALDEARRQFRLAWEGFHKVELDETLCLSAAAVAENTALRTLDALHLAAAERVRDEATKFLTYDGRQAEAARSLEWIVLGFAFESQP